MNKKRIFATLLVVTLLGVLAYLQFRTWRDFDWHAFLMQTRQTNPWRLAAGMVLIYSTYLLRAIRWKIMLRPTKAVPTRALLSAQVIGFTGVALLGRPGDLLRPYLIGRRHNLSLSSQVAVLAVERVLDVACFAILLTVDVLFFPIALPNEHLLSNFRLAGTLLLAFVAFLVAGLYLVWRSGEVVAAWVGSKLHPYFPKLAASLCDKIKTFSEGLHTIKDASSFLQLTGISLLIWIVIAFAYVQVTQSYPAELHVLSIPEVILVMSASIAGSLLQLPMVGGGSQLGTITVLERVFGISKELAASCGIMLWLITFVAVVPMGLVLSRIEHINLREAEHDAEALVPQAGPR
jgi:glycosyltransferase 2 family protein